ncbi:protein kinase domain-containing protein [Neorhodopirellula pilleata]|uniref:Serine/threonine-protein kinase Pkn1 n=1 Tax=Neorhodopirellula pilleata TaxID=2714738 RepID=A0A5C6AXI0_9BACT|nr:protein kinase [Neorhodopirellula pilleata]TWU03776.1 Serine/threonine-protein kinase Pkn1 [Neorhodopirellula pilleata]
MTTQSHAYDFLQPPTHPGDLGMLGNYRILGELGKGGMGFVFRAEDTVLERAVALKVMNKRIASTPNSRERFLQEARAMAAVHHDNVVVIFEVGTHEGTPFMAMEMLRGETLEAVNARKEARDYVKVIDYASQISRGLAAAHAKGIVHRDIKPANIWIEQNSNRIKILDFGLALAQSPLDEFTGVGSVCGTPGYLTPEQARSDPLDDRSDLYSLGVVLYEMCTGRLPIQKPAIAEQLVALLSHEPRRVRDLNPDIPQPLADLIHQLLAKEPVDRPASAAALEKRLKKVAVECEAKSEVALSLNKLQASLKEVVSKQTTEVEEPIEIIEELPAFDHYDPLAIPALNTLPNPNSPAASAPAMPSRIKQGGTPVRSETKPSAPATTVSPVVWLAAGVGLTLAFVALGVWMIWPSDQENYVVLPPSPDSASMNAGPANNTPTNNSTPKPERPDDNSSVKKPPVEQPNTKTPSGNKNQQRPKDQPIKGKGKGNQKSQGEQKNQGRSNAPATAQPSLSSTDDSLNPSEPDSMLPETRSESSVAIRTDDIAAIDSMKPEMLDDVASPKPVVKKVPTRSIPVTAEFGLGADATVRKIKPKLSFGKKNNLMVQRVNGEDAQHAYLRFDLQSVDVDRSEIQDVIVRLKSLTPVKGNKVELRLYGADTAEAEDWQEEGDFAIKWENSESANGLESLDQLVDLEFIGTDESYVSFQSPALTDFVRKSGRRTLTFVIAGGQEDNAAALFSSRDNPDGEPPTLYLAVPKN